MPLNSVLPMKLCKVDVSNIRGDVRSSKVYCVDIFEGLRVTSRRLRCHAYHPDPMEIKSRAVAAAALEAMMTVEFELSASSSAGAPRSEKTVVIARVTLDVIEWIDVADVSTVDVVARLKELLKDAVDVMVTLVKLLEDAMDVSIIKLKLVADIESVDVVMACAVDIDEVASSGTDDDDDDERTGGVPETAIVDVRLLAGCPGSHGGIVDDMR